MSSEPQDNFSMPDVEDFSYREAFVIIGIVMAVLVTLLVLRFGFNLIIIDLCIMCDFEEAKRECIQFRNKFMPWFKRRMVSPEAMDQQQQNEQDGSPLGAARPAEVEMMNLDSLLTGLLIQERWQVIESILPSKIVSPDDLARWAKQPSPKKSEATTPTKAFVGDNSVSSEDAFSLSSGTSHFMTCSICLHDIEIGSTVVELSNTCGHVYHRKCIYDWLHANKTECPFCRTPMMSEQQIKDAVQQLLKQRKDGDDDKKEKEAEQQEKGDNSDDGIVIV